jgi:phosphoglycolate phosphatase-like HAD superfamily hydrolase
MEILRPGATAHGARVALFDFDGTISTIRSGWVDVMVPMMVEALVETKSGESEAELTEIVREFVGRLTGRQTIYQMIELVENIEKRGGKALDPLEYKHRYLELLWVQIKDRVETLEKGYIAPEKYVVPGSFELLDMLQERGMKFYLASGTDHDYMKREAHLLGLERYFGEHIYGALDDYKSFSKAILIQRLINGAEAKGEEFLGFGDGYVEIENVKAVGGVTVGVASDETACERVDEWKRDRLVNVGADYIVPNFLCHRELAATLFPQ